MSNITPESIMSDLRYLQLLSRSFPTIADASTEIINLEAILNLPKGTEHFLTDIHGEYLPNIHVQRYARHFRQNFRISFRNCCMSRV